jgi:8-oxo-dGTP pyrophosphatase MutT (NUDIX family)
MSSADPWPQEGRVLRRLIEERLAPTRPPLDPSVAWPAGLSGSNAEDLRKYFPPSPTAAAVLVPIVDHADGLTVLLTQRSPNLRTHAGQVSFPGGRIESDDAGPLQAALREAEEEIGLAPEHVEVVGYLEAHLVLTGYWITPVVGFVRPGFSLQLDAREVEAAIKATSGDMIPILVRRSGYDFWVALRRR